MAIVMFVRNLIASYVMMFKVIYYFFCLFEVTHRFPGCFLIFFPLDPVLDPILLDLFIEDYLNFIFFLTFNSVWWQLALLLLSLEKICDRLLENIAIKCEVDFSLW